MGFNFGAFKSIAISSAAGLVPSIVNDLAGALGFGITLPGGPSSYDWNRIKVEISIYDAEPNEYWKVPVIPPSVDVKAGDMLLSSVKVINIGTVDFPNGTDLDEITWTSFFPARYDASYCGFPDIKAPMDYVGMYGGWQVLGTKLRLICPAAQLDYDVILKSFSWKLVGFEGDVEYTATFKQFRTVMPKQVKTGGELPPKGKKQPQERPAPPGGSSTGGGST